MGAWDVRVAVTAGAWLLVVVVVVAVAGAAACMMIDNMA